MRALPWLWPVRVRACCSSQLKVPLLGFLTLPTCKLWVSSSTCVSPPPTEAPRQPSEAESVVCDVTVEATGWTSAWHSRLPRESSVGQDPSPGPTSASHRSSLMGSNPLSPPMASQRNAPCVLRRQHNSCMSCTFFPQLVRGRKLSGTVTGSMQGTTVEVSPRPSAVPPPSGRVPQFTPINRVFKQEPH